MTYEDVLYVFYVITEFIDKKIYLKIDLFVNIAGFLNHFNKFIIVIGHHPLPLIIALQLQMVIFCCMI